MYNKLTFCFYIIVKFFIIFIYFGFLSERIFSQSQRGFRKEMGVSTTGKGSPVKPVKSPVIFFSELQSLYLTFTHFFLFNFYRAQPAWRTLRG